MFERLGAFFVALPRTVARGWLVFLVAIPAALLGLIIGYDIGQPSLVAAPTQELLKRLDDVEKLLVSMQIEQPRSIAAEAAELATKVDAAASAVRVRAPDAAKKLDGVIAQVAALDGNLRKQNIVYDRTLGTQIAAVRNERTRLLRQAEATQPFTVTVYDQAKRFLKWIGAISFLTVLTIGIFLILLTVPAFRSFVARAGSVTAFGLTLDFRDLETTRASLTSQQREVEAGVKAAYQAAVSKERLSVLFASVVAELAKAFSARNVTLSRLHYRATLFVPGFIGQDLVQASRYVGTHNLGDETKIGRPFSTRYGIIGKAWRLQKSLYNPQVSNSSDELIREWGFNKDEARPFAVAAGGVAPTASLMAFVIRDVGNAPPLGVVYIEAQDANQLHDPTPPGPWDQARCEAYAEAIWNDLANNRVLEKLKLRLKALQEALTWNQKVQQGEGR